MPGMDVNLDELAIRSPVYKVPSNTHASPGQEYAKDQKTGENDLVIAAKLHPGSNNERPSDGTPEQYESKFAAKLYTVSYLILFAILGTLSRLGLQDIAFYAGAPVTFSVLWANFGGSLFMGYLIEDRVLFGQVWAASPDNTQPENHEPKSDEERGSRSSNNVVDLTATLSNHAATKKTIPLFIGLTTGFCGSFTSFSSFIRGTFLALSNDLPTPVSHSSQVISATSTVPRSGGYSFMASVAVVVITVTSCISGFCMGTHLAIALEPYSLSLPYTFIRKILDRAIVLIAWGCWLGAVLLSILPPDRNSGGAEVWRGRAVYAIVFAPLGCLGRFLVSLYLNRKTSSFPLGTFAVNIVGTAILGIIWDLQHLEIGGVVGCQVLQGVEDGFCGCLTTVSTWVAEMSTLRLWHAYRYGSSSVIVALCFLVVIMGSLRWTAGFADILCVK
jgi:fluoride exporter